MSEEVLLSNFKALDFLSVLEGYIQDVYMLNAIRVSKKCSPYVFKMFRRPLWGQDFD
jgi:hypothetical protein